MEGCGTPARTLESIQDAENAKDVTTPKIDGTPATSSNTPDSIEMEKQISVKQMIENKRKEVEARNCTRRDEVGYRPVERKKASVCTTTTTTNEPEPNTESCLGDSLDTKPFRLNTRQIYMVYPIDSSLDPTLLGMKEKVLSTILDHLKNQVQEIVVGNVSEKRQKTVRVYLKFNQKKNYKSPNCLDWVLDGVQGTYSSVHNKTTVIQLCTQDKDYVSHGIAVERWINKGTTTSPTKRKRRNSQTQECAKDILENGMDLEDIEEKYSGLYMMNKGKIASFYEEIKAKRESSEKKGLADVDENKLKDMFPDEQCPERKILHWIHTNVGKERKFKQQQLWLWSTESDLGKTTLVMKLMERVNVYLIPDGCYTDEYKDGVYELAYIDEMDESKHPHKWINEWAQGSPMKLNQKFGRYFKRQNIATIILANQPISETWPKMNVNTVKARFLEIEIKEGIFKLIDNFI